ncbi:hypothetical protein GGI02_004375 [Coemansia sp. RSA 2322]|nr:hypothetical protein GGI02_004375 [Coemansia sp. RSA 2322]
MASDATVVEYPTSGVSSGGGKNSKVERKSPSLSCTSSQSKTASPAPPATETADLGKRRRGGGRGGRSKYTAEEKEMRRKISHSAIEKRRRERTNNVLRDLQDMVPWLSKSSKVQKLEILEAAAQHIKELRAASGAPLFVRSSASPASSRPIDDDSEDDDDDEVSSSSPSAMKVNFLLS